MRCNDYDFQHLDNPPGPDINPPIRRSFIVAMQKLSKNNDLYPRHFALEGVTEVESNPVAIGRFADVYKGNLQGQAVCLKMVKVFEVEEMVKVGLF